MCGVGHRAGWSFGIVVAGAEFEIVAWAWTVVSPLLLVLGSFGNVMSVIIVRRVQSGLSTVRVYFTALAVSDMLALYFSVACFMRAMTLHELRNGFRRG